MKLKPIIKGDSSSFQVDTFWDEVGQREISPANGWVVKFYVKGGGNSKEFVGDADWVINITAALSAELTAGICSFFLYAFKDTERIQINTGSIQVFADGVSADGTFDGKSFARNMLEKIREAMLARAEGSHIDEYLVEGRSTKFCPMEELVKMEKEFLLRVQQEESTSGNRQQTRITHLRYR